MGQRKFRLSDMMPNSWFYKLRDMRRAGGRSGASQGVLHRSSSSLGSKRSAQPAGTPRPVPAPMPHRSSYYYASMDRELKPAPAAKPTAATEDRHHQQQPAIPQAPLPATSSRRRHRAGPVVKETAPEAEAPVARRRRRDVYVGRDGGGGGADDGKVRRHAVKAPSSRDIPSGGKVITSETDIIFDLCSPHPDDMPERVLRPIATRPAARREAGSRCEPKERHAVVHHGATTTTTTPRASSASEQGNNSRRSSVSSGRRLKTRANSPRLVTRSRKGKSTTPAAGPERKTSRAPPPSSPLAESFAVVKASMDPRRDFRESMEEMIADKGIRGAADLEDLLACYLALNADEHHGLIVEVFEDIWRSLAGANP